MARIEILGSMIKGGAGFDYLRKAFVDCHGMPSNAMRSLPVTVQWIISLKNTAEHEWHEHTDILSTLTSQDSSATIHGGLPSAGNLRSGGSRLSNGVKDMMPEGLSKRGSLFYNQPWNN